MESPILLLHALDKHKLKVLIAYSRATLRIHQGNMSRKGFVEIKEAIEYAEKILGR